MASSHSSIPIESHPIEPWLPENAHLLMCGTFPPDKKRWSMDFYYPNFINDMWRIFGIIFKGNKDYFINIQEKTYKLNLIKELLNEKGIALSDTGRKVKRLMGNASDKHLEILQPIDLKAALAQMPNCNAIATTGEKAAGIVAHITGSDIPALSECVTFDGDIIGRKGVVIRHFRMPSSSRAYPMKLNKKAQIYGEMMAALGMISMEELIANLNYSK